MNSKINVFIVAGFLGSGKTTFLNKLLKHFCDEKNVIIENEFGKINIDATLINGAFESVYELTNGCICCSINNQLLDTLLQIDNLAEKPNNLFIETTGIADAGDIASTFKNLQVLEKFDLKKVICIVDAENIKHYIDSNIEIYKQIVAADIVIINKTEHIISVEIDGIKNLIQSINPFAEIISNSENLNKENLLTANDRNSVNLNQSINIENKHKIKSVLYETEKFFDIQKLKYELFKTLFLYYHQIFRIKGFVRDKDNRVYLVQSVGKTSSVTLIEDMIVEKSQLVFIGTILELKTIERILKPALDHINNTNVHHIS